MHITQHTVPTQCTTLHCNFTSEGRSNNDLVACFKQHKCQDWDLNPHYTYYYWSETPELEYGTWQWQATLMITIIVHSFLTHITLYLLLVSKRVLFSTGNSVEWWDPFKQRNLLPVTTMPETQVQIPPLNDKCTLFSINTQDLSLYNALPPVQRTKQLLCLAQGIIAIAGTRIHTLDNTRTLVRCTTCRSLGYDTPYYPLYVIRTTTLDICKLSCLFGVCF